MNSLVIETSMLSIYAVAMTWLFYHYNNLIQGTIKGFFYTFLVLMVIRVAISATSALINNKEWDEVAQIAQDWCSVVQITLFLFIAFKMKKIEIQLNPSYTTVREVTKKLERFLCIMRFVGVIYLLVFGVIAVLTWYTIYKIIYKVQLD